MLVLQRKKGESLLIGGNISVSISDVGADWVKLAIDAPSDVRIMRKELLEAANLNKEASVISKDSISKLKDLINNK